MSELKCPECGADLRKVGIRKKEGEKRWMLVWGWVLIVLSLLGVLS
ncbi:hypothetical protein JD969_12655 [Planctomycetota bacterium]|nr:hypothetical protein JD969_12655 [Planctomycetota bacterium]